MMILRRIWFCLTVPKNFLEKLFCVSELFWYGKKFMDEDGGGKEYHVFPSSFFLSHSAPKLRGATNVSESFGYQKFYA